MATPTRGRRPLRIESRLGAGGMSTVFLANDTVLERPVAVKLLAEHLAEDEDFVARFRREALAAARLQHPNIVRSSTPARTRTRSATTSSWSTWTARRAPTCCASRSELDVERDGADRCATPATASTTPTVPA